MRLADRLRLQDCSCAHRSFSRFTLTSEGQKKRPSKGPKGDNAACYLGRLLGARPRRMAFSSAGATGGWFPFLHSAGENCLKFEVDLVASVEQVPNAVGGNVHQYLPRLRHTVRPPHLIASRSCFRRRDFVLKLLENARLSACWRPRLLRIKIRPISLSFPHH